MKLYAQHGYGPGEKIERGLATEVIDGAILGAKDIAPGQIEDCIGKWRAAAPDAEVLFDSQFHACMLPHHDDNRFGHLPDYDYWGSGCRAQSDLMRQDRVDAELKSCLEFQAALQVSALIAPNIVVRRSLDSREAAIATAFITRSASVARKADRRRRVLATLALSREALLDRSELESFVDLLVSLDEPPHGFYLLLSCANSVRSEVFHEEVISNLLFLVHSLKLNGFEVVVGYSDALGPILATAGADAGASGWFNTLRIFSLNRFAPSEDDFGRRPRLTYFSSGLFNRILVSELTTAVRFNAAVRNRYPTDRPYFSANEVIEPDRIKECLQSWDALRRLQMGFSAGILTQRLDRLNTHVAAAVTHYAALKERGLVFETKSSGSHLSSVQDGVAEFRRDLGA